MEKTIVLATQNQGKVKEMNEILEKLGLSAITRDDAGVPKEYDVVEDGETLEENSYKKAKAILEICGKPTLADDSGLMVDYLNGAPGVYSARFAGEQCSHEDNNRKMLELLDGVPWEKRTARFRTVITLLFPDGREIVASGDCEGHIAVSLQGDGGFGYDPLFVPDGYDETFAQLGRDIKNSISHRAKALISLEKQLTE